MPIAYCLLGLAGSLEHTPLRFGVLDLVALDDVLLPQHLPNKIAKHTANTMKFTRKTTYFNREFDSIPLNKWLI